MRNPKLSIIVVSFNTKDYLEKCLRSVYKHVKNVNFELIVVDNNSQDGSVSYLQKLKAKNKNLELIKVKKNLGFAGGNNEAFKKAKGQYVLLLNSDTEIKTGFFKEILDWMDKHEDVGIVSTALKNADGSDQVSGGYFPNLFRVIIWMTIQDLPFMDRLVSPFHPKEAFKKTREVDWVTGAFFMIRSEVLDDLKGFDPDYFMYTEEVDMCFRAKKLGWKVMFQPKWSIIHYGGASSSKEYAILSEIKGLKTFFKKHYPSWQYPLLRFFLKLGAFLRLPFNFQTYAKAFKQA